MLKEFKEFALKGNVMDLAVGVIIGAAFGKIVDSVVNDLIMPVVGRALGGLDFSNYFLALKAIPPGTATTALVTRCGPASPHTGCGTARSGIVARMARCFRRG